MYFLPNAFCILGKVKSIKLLKNLASVWTIIDYNQ